MAREGGRRRLVGLRRDARLQPLHPSARDSRASPPVRQSEEDVNALPQSSSDTEDGAADFRRGTDAKQTAPDTARPRSRASTDREELLQMSRPTKRAKATYGKAGSRASNQRKDSKDPKRTTVESEAPVTQDSAASPTDSSPKQREFHMPPQVSVASTGKKAAFRLPGEITLPRAEAPTFCMPAAVAKPAAFSTTTAGSKAAKRVFSSVDLDGGTDGSEQSNAIALVLSSSPNDDLTSSNTVTSLLAASSAASIERASSPDPASGSVCPVCRLPVSAEALSEFNAALASTSLAPRARSARYAAFHQVHRELSARETWSKCNYPEIGWENLTSRFKPYRRILKATLEGKRESYFKSKLEAQLAEQRGTGRHAIGRITLNEEFEREGDGIELVGYYGGRGRQLMMMWLMSDLSKELRRAQERDPLVRGCGSLSMFVQRVLVPELAMLLMIEDMRAAAEDSVGRKSFDNNPSKSKIKEQDSVEVAVRSAQDDPSEAELETARLRLKESAELGRLLCGEEDDEIMGEETGDELAETDSEEDSRDSQQDEGDFVDVDDL